MRSATASEVVFFTRDPGGQPHLVASTLPITIPLRDGIAASITVAPGSRNGRDAQLVGREVALGGVRWMSHSASLATAGGDIVGGFAVLRPHDDALATLSAVRRSLFTAAGLGFVLALLAAWIAARSVTQPVRALASFS